MLAGELNNSFFTQYGKFYSAYNVKSNTSIPFKSHQQLPVIVDILSRKERHHALLYSNFTPKMRIAFLEALLQHLTQDHIPLSLRDAELVYLDIEHIAFTKTAQKNIEKDIQIFLSSLENAARYQLIALPNIRTLLKPKKIDTSFLRKQLHLLQQHPKCRLLSFADPREEMLHAEQFSTLQLTPPVEADITLLLKQHRMELENFHHVIIPEELLSYAYALSERYLSTHDVLGNALLLLDSAAARGSVTERADLQFKPALTTSALAQVLSNWTQIPESHIHLNRFKPSEFAQGIHQRVFGQEAAISVIGHKLQQAQAHLQIKTGTFCSLLFAGAKHSGKKTTALALTEQLFKHLNMLYFAHPPMPNINSIIEIKLERSLDKHYAELKDVIRTMPYAVIVFEDIEKFTPLMLDGLQEILTTGLLHDSEGNEYNFRQAIVILTTTLGENCLKALAKSFVLDEDTDPVDLMQLVMSGQKSQEFSVAQHCSPQELVDEIFPEIAASLSQTIARHAHLVPFLPLNKSSIEKIIYLKLKLLVKQLDTRYGIELSYAPEVVRYLAEDVLLKQKENLPADTDKALKQLYFCVEQAILNQVDNKNRPNQLFLQLNETGQMLRCDWSAITPLRHHHPS